MRECYDTGWLNDGLHDVIEALRLDYLLIDTHPGVNEETLLSIALSDALILILRPDSQDFQGTAVTVELAKRLEVPDLMIVVNKVPDGSDVELIREQVEGAYGGEVASLLPLNLEMSRLGSGGLFINRYPHHPFTICLQNLAQRVMQGPQATVRAQ